MLQAVINEEQASKGGACVLAEEEQIHTFNDHWYSATPGLRQALVPKTSNGIQTRTLARDKRQRQP